MTFSERLNKLIEEKGISNYKIAKELGMSPSTIANYREGKTQPSYDVMQALFNYLDYNSSNLMEDKPTYLIKEVTPVIQSNIMMVPLVHQFAQAGYMCGYSDPEFIESLPRVPFFVDHNGKGNYMCFEVRGESMFDGSYSSYMEGDIVLCREISKEHWRHKLHINKWNFVIVHRNEGILIKQIVKHDIEQGTITIHSLNPEFSDKVLLLDEIDKLFNVIKFERG